MKLFVRMINVIVQNLCTCKWKSGSADGNCALVIAYMPEFGANKCFTTVLEKSTLDKLFMRWIMELGSIKQR